MTDIIRPGESFRDLRSRLNAALVPFPSREAFEQTWIDEAVSRVGVHVEDAFHDLIRDPAGDWQSADGGLWRIVTGNVTLAEVPDLVAAANRKSTRFFASQADAVAAGPAAIPTGIDAILVREGDALVTRERFSTEDPLFEGASSWGLGMRIEPGGPDLTAEVAALQAAGEDLEQRIAPTGMHRGDSAVIARIGGVPVISANRDGQIRAEFDPWTKDKLLEGIEPGGPDLTAEVAALQAAGEDLEQRIAPTGMHRGDSAVIARIGGVPVISANRDGQIRAEFDPWTKDKLLEGIEPGGGSGEGVSFLPPDVLGDGIDGWNVWATETGLTMFTGQIWGAAPRAYLRRSAEDPWADGPSRARILLTYGDGLANATTDRGPDRIAHIATLADGYGQDGLNGAATAAASTGIERAGGGIGGVVADQWLARKAGAMPWVCVRSEAVEGATFSTLVAGQPRANLLRAITQFQASLAHYARTSQVDALILMHGGDLDNADYGADLLAFAEAMIADTGAASVVAFAPAGTSANGGQAAVARAMDAIDLRGTVPLIVAGPLYWCDIRPGTLATPVPAHMTMLAELAAHALLSGEWWVPPKAFHAARTGNVVTVDFDVMPDHQLVAPTIGLEWTGGGAITSVDVVADPDTARLTRLQITLSAAGAGTIRYAMQPTGADPSRFAGRGDLRDDWGAPSITGGTLRRHAFAFAFEV